MAEAPAGGYTGGYTPYSNQSPNYGAMAAGFAQGAGSTGFWSSLDMAFSPRSRRYKKAVKRYKKRIAYEAMQRSIRNKEQFEDDTAYREQILQQSLHGRGLGNSSIAREDTDRFDRAKQRALANLDAEIELAKMGYDVLKKYYKHQQHNQYAQYVDQLFGIAGGVAGAAF